MPSKIYRKLTGLGFTGEPTLSGLIAACGDKFYTLLHGEADIENEVYPWAAISTLNKETGEYVQGCGNTPEEAVAELYINLNSTPKCPRRKRKNKPQAS